MLVKTKTMLNTCVSYDMFQDYVRSSIFLSANGYSKLQNTKTKGTLTYKGHEF